MNREIIFVFICIILVILLAGGITLLGEIKIYNDHHIYTEPGFCPDCNTKLVKGVWGMYTPNVCWYCPNCE